MVEYWSNWAPKVVQGKFPLCYPVTVQSFF